MEFALILFYLAVTSVRNDCVKYGNSPGGRVSRTPGKSYSEPAAQRQTCSRHASAHLLRGRSLEMHLMHSLNSNRSIYRNTEGGGQNKDTKADFYTTWTYLTFQFHLIDTWLSGEVQRESSCALCLSENSFFKKKPLKPGVFLEPTSTSHI